mmetsp:Transcript_952/g.2724  ORF Transcript_952/g.2724 Transcript_952/m.2724 type:complete len:275 (-) Transcript_952:197-1021(-)
MYRRNCGDPRTARGHRRRRRPSAAAPTRAAASPSPTPGMTTTPPTTRRSTTITTPTTSSRTPTTTRTTASTTSPMTTCTTTTTPTATTPAATPTTRRSSTEFPPHMSRSHVDDYHDTLKGVGGVAVGEEGDEDGGAAVEEGDGLGEEGEDEGGIADGFAALDVPELGGLRELDRVSHRPQARGGRHGPSSVQGEVQHNQCVPQRVERPQRSRAPAHLVRRQDPVRPSRRLGELQARVLHGHAAAVYEHPQRVPVLEGPHVLQQNARRHAQSKVT